MASIQDCPDEVLLKIFRLLGFTSAANLRLASRRLAEVGAESFVKRVHFFAHQDSLKRLHSIAHHEVLCKHVDTVIFDGNILADVGCIHTYSMHFDLDHHKDDRPQPPGRNASGREKRLFERNMTKWHQEIEKKWEKARNVFEEQQALVKSDAYAHFIAPSMSRFPRLKKVILNTIGRCRHMLSERFLETYALDCAIPMEIDTRYTKSQLRHLLIPQGNPVTHVRELEVHVLSPLFFTDFVPCDQIVAAFRSLRVVDLSFRAEKNDSGDSDMAFNTRQYAGFSNGTLRRALEAAEELENLTLNFEELGFFGACTTVETVLGDHTWPKLRALDLDCMSTTDVYLMNMLKRQPALTSLRIGFFILDSGKWPETTRRMRDELKVIVFDAHGLLEDPERMYAMHLIDSDTYLETRDEFSLGDALDIYVTSTASRAWYEGLASDDDDEDLDMHPLNDPGFVEPEDLHDELDSFSDMDLTDDFSDMDCD